MRLSTFISYETADKGPTGPSAGEKARKGTATKRGGTRRTESHGEDEGRRVKEDAWNGRRRRGDIIAGGLMRRHNCTIIDDRFIRRPAAALWTGAATEDTAPRSHIIIRRVCSDPVCLAAQK